MRSSFKKGVAKLLITLALAAFPVNTPALKLDAEIFVEHKTSTTMTVEGNVEASEIKNYRLSVSFSSSDYVVEKE